MLRLHAFLFLFLSLNLFGQNRFESRKFISGKDTLPYRMVYPDYDTIRYYPLVVFLHGSGEVGRDNEAQLRWGESGRQVDIRGSRYIPKPAILYGYRPILIH